MGTSFSGPTTADGASAFYNPAAMSAGRGTLLEIDGGLVVVGLGYEPAAPPPLSAASTTALGPLLTLGGYTDALHPEWRLGLSVGVPSTSGGSWARDSGAAPVTRYFLAAGNQFHIAAVPAVSWAPTEWIAIGLGANLRYGSVTSDLDKDFGAHLNQTYWTGVCGSDPTCVPELESPFPYAHPDLAAPVTLHADGVGVGAILGVLVSPIPELSFGVSLHSPVIVDGRGSLEVAYPEVLRQFVADTLPTAELPELAANIDVALDAPLFFVAGVSARPHEMVELAANYQFEHLSSQPNFYLYISEATSETIVDSVKPQAYLDRHRAFLQVAVIPIPVLRVALHGVYQSNSVPENVVAANSIDFHRVEVGLALRWQIVDELSLLVQYSHLFLSDRDVQTSLHRPLTQPSLAAFNHPSPTGRYTGSADTIRVGVALHFDGAAPTRDEPAPLDPEPAPQ